MRPYKQLSLEERRKIEKWRAANISVDVIAERLGRDRSTIFRELRRNHFTDAQMPDVVGYFGVVAAMKALSRRQKDRKLMRHPELRELIIERIKDGWTPEQIAGRLIYEKAPVRVCQETIYRFVYSPEGMQEDLWWYLPEHRRKRRTRKGRASKKPKIHPDLGISNRPEIIADRVQFGHWESDLMLFKRKFGLANVTSLVERVSRFTVLLANSNRTTGRVMGRLAKVMRTLPQKARKSITFDRGSEFMDWPHLQAEVGTQTWFCDPSAPFRDIAARYPSGQCMAKRNRRKHQSTRPKMAAARDRPHDDHKSSFRNDLCPSQRHTPQVPWVENASGGLQRKNLGSSRMTPQTNTSSNVAVQLSLTSYLIGDHGMGTVYAQLSLSERRKIEKWWHAKVPVREMARVLKRRGKHQSPRSKMASEEARHYGSLRS